MKQQPSLDQLLSAWRAEPLPPTRATPTKEGSVAVAYALREVARRRRRQRLLQRSGLLAAVAALVLGLSLWIYERPPASLAAQPGAENGARAVTLQDSVGDVRVIDRAGAVVLDAPKLAEGYALRTKDGTASLGFPSGAAARVSKKSAVKVTATERTEALLLTRGRVDVEVPKLDAERGFSVETPDAKVVVHGTGFSVRVDPLVEHGVRTSVSVTHGVVSVQHEGREVRLTAGQRWPEDFMAAPAAAAAGDDAEADGGEAAADEVVREKPKRRGGKHGRTRRAPTARESRELAEQNGHFARAMTLKNQGQTQGALDELTHLLSSHPASPLRQEARVERLRILRSLGHADEAASEARHYLSDFPDGYAAQEARELLEEQP
jgi:hypothetical protein